MPKTNLPELEEKHLVWIFQTAVEAYDKRLKEAEMELTRHTLMHGMQMPHVDGHCTEKTREHKMQDAKRCVDQSREMLISVKAAVSHLQENAHLFETQRGNIFQLIKTLF